MTPEQLDEIERDAQPYTNELALVTALREARASVLHWRTQWAVMAELANQNLREKQNAESERDEARAEVERLRELSKTAFTLEQIRDVTVKMIDECSQNSTPMPYRKRTSRKNKP